MIKYIYLEMKFSIIVVNGKPKHLPQVKIIEKANKRKQNDGINSSLAVLLCYGALTSRRHSRAKLRLVDESKD